MRGVLNRGGACLLALAAAAAAPRAPAAPTFTKDIAPILYRQCVACHRPDGPAPFSLLSHDDVRKHATQIVEVTRSRFMPPWKADGGCRCVSAVDLHLSSLERGNRSAAMEFHIDLSL